MFLIKTFPDFATGLLTDIDTTVTLPHWTTEHNGYKGEIVVVSFVIAEPSAIGGGSGINITMYGTRDGTSTDANDRITIAGINNAGARVVGSTAIWTAAVTDPAERHTWFFVNASAGSGGFFPLPTNMFAFITDAGAAYTGGGTFTIHMEIWKTTQTRIGPIETIF